VSIHARVVVFDAAATRAHRTSLGDQRPLLRQVEPLSRVRVLFPVFLQLRLAFRSFVDDPSTVLVLQLLPLLAFVFRAQTPDAQARLLVELADADTRRFNGHGNSRKTWAAARSGFSISHGACPRIKLILSIAAIEARVLPDAKMPASRCAFELPRAGCASSSSITCGDHSFFQR
jgi:hypothetical protein